MKESITKISKVDGVPSPQASYSVVGGVSRLRLCRCPASGGGLTPFGNTVRLPLGTPHVA